MQTMVDYGRLCVFEPEGYVDHVDCVLDCVLDCVISPMIATE